MTAESKKLAEDAVQLLAFERAELGMGNGAVAADYHGKR